MTHLIELSDETFSRLQSHAAPLIDTSESVVNRALDALEADGRLKAPSNISGARLFDGANPPNLTFTTIRSIKLCGSRFSPNQWNALLLAVVEEAMKRLNDCDKVKELIVVNCVSGEKTDTGYKYLPSADISVQGQDANNAWKGIAHIARNMDISIEIVFMWHDNPKAAHSGLTGRFLIEGR